MNQRLEELWANAADDGARSPVGLARGPREAEVDELLAAWFKERSHHIEGSLLLQEARRLLSRLLAEGGGSSGSRNRAERLIHLIRSYQKIDG